MNSLVLQPLKSTHGKLTLPGSKSISNRVLLLAALAKGRTLVRALLDSDDTRVMLAALKELGVKWERVEQDGKPTDDYWVEGVGGDFPNKNAKLFMGNAGTAIRPLTAALALQQGNYHLSGVPRMHERPIGDLIDGLRQIGAVIDYTGNEGFPPLHIQPAQIHVAAPIKVRGDVSSQFLTALLLNLPRVPKTQANADGQIVIEVVGELISKPYIEITLNLLARFGIKVQREGWERFIFSAGEEYQSPGEIYVEGDASSASYFLAAGALGYQAELGPLRIEGVGENSIQGDVKFADALALMGAKISKGDNYLEVAGWDTPNHKPCAITLDCNHIPDAAMTLAVVALFAEGEGNNTTTLTNIASWRVKETDRLSAMATELRKLGATVVEGADFIAITPPASLSDWKTPEAGIDTYDDHRMAMCFALAAFGPLPIKINEPECVAKTFPDFFAQFAKVTNYPINWRNLVPICVKNATF